jgi:anti-sigma factor RsiW
VSGWGRAIRSAAEHVMSEQRDKLGPPPTPEELAAYVEGTLSAADRERVEEAIAADPAVARTVLDLESFPEVEPAPEWEGLEEPDAGGWQRLRDRLAAEGFFAAPVAPVASPERVARPAPRPAPSPFSPRAARFGFALAAGFALTTLALGVLVAWLLAARSPGAGVRRNPVVASLLPEGEVERGGAQEAVTVPPGAEAIVLSLALLEAPEHPSLRLEVFDAAERRVWAVGGLEPTAHGGVRVDLPRDLLAAGAYRLELVAAAGGRRVPLATYRLRLVFE